GMQNYNSLESKGINLWNLGQESTRWNVFRYNNLAHNTLAVNGKFQNVKGKANIDKCGFEPNFRYAISDLSKVYENQLKSVKRGVAIVNQQYVVIQDEIESSAKTDTVRWTTLTDARVEIAGENSFVLSLNNKKMLVKFETSGRLNLKTWSTKPTTDYDVANDGKTLFGFEMILKPNSKQTVCTKFIPNSLKNKPLRFRQSLNNWK
ncbi:MAG: heparinase, partial [Paludibacter sp.]